MYGSMRDELEKIAVTIDMKKGPGGVWSAPSAAPRLTAGKKTNIPKVKTPRAAGGLFGGIGKFVSKHKVPLMIGGAAGLGAMMLSRNSSNQEQ